MNLLEVLHQRWAAAGALDDLLPATRVSTGLSVDPTLPYAVIRKTSDRPAVGWNDSASLRTVEVRIQVFHDNLAAAMAILQQITAAFDRTAFALSGNDQVIDMQRVNDFEQQEDDGVWRLVIDFQCRVLVHAQ